MMVEFRIRRFYERKLFWQSFEVPVKRSMTVLEALSTLNGFDHDFACCGALLH